MKNLVCWKSPAPNFTVYPYMFFYYTFLHTNSPKTLCMHTDDMVIICFISLNGLMSISHGMLPTNTFTLHNNVNSFSRAVFLEALLLNICCSGDVVYIAM